MPLLLVLAYRPTEEWVAATAGAWHPMLRWPPLHKLELLRRRFQRGMCRINQLLQRLVHRVAQAAAAAMEAGVPHGVGQCHALATGVRLYYSAA